MRTVRVAAAGVAAVFLSACGGGGAPVNSTLPQASDRSYTEATTTSSAEQLLVAVWSQSSSLTVMHRYAIPAGTSLGTLQLKAKGFPTATYASVDDRYIISVVPGASSIDVYGPGNSVTALPYESGTVVETTSLSTNLLTLALFQQNIDTQQVRIVLYREPFVSPFSTTTVSVPTQAGFVALNGQGTQAIGFPGTQLNNALMIQPLPSGKQMSISLNPNEESAQQFVIDGRVSWVYSLALPPGSSSENEIDIGDTAHDKYLGYINAIAASPSGMAVDQVTDDLYVAIGSKISDYNIPYCGCTIPRHVFSSPISNPKLAVDRLGKHLFVYGNTGKIYDLNPKSGSVQGTYPGPTSSSLSIAAVLAQ
jgi:hypothetical protein